MKTTRKLIVVCFTLAGAVSAYAEPTVHDVSIGTFSTDSGYDALTVSMGVGNLDSVYAEFQKDSKYELFIWNHRLSEEGLTAVLRLDDGKARVGLKLFFGDTGLVARGLVGAGPDRIDVWTPAVEFYNTSDVSFGVSGWVRAQNGLQPDFWIEPLATFGRFSAATDLNLRKDGDNCIWTSYSLVF